MATGIQTGMRTGSRSGLATGRGGLGKAPGGGGPLGKLKDIWGGLGKTHKTIIFSLLAVLLVGGLGVWKLSSANAPQALYSTKMGPTDVREVAHKLTELGVWHEVNETNDGILVYPRDRPRAQMQLAAYGLPRHPITTPYNVEEAGLAGKTQAEQRALRQRMLEGELTETIRQVEGVADAYVKLAQPEETFFRDDTRPSTATVTLRLQPGYKLNRQQVQGIVHLMAFSVPELKTENVKILDDHAMDLTAGVPLSGEEGGGVASGQQLETKEKLEAEAEQKVQQQLDTWLGPGRATASVDFELDFSQIERTSKRVGGPGDQGTVVTGRQKKIEQFQKDPKATTEGAQQLSTQAEEGAEPAAASSAMTRDKDANYAQEVESVKIAHDELVTRQVDKSYRIKRKTCSVVVDNLKQDQVDKISGIIKNTIGIDESRGDSLMVASLPFDKTAAFGPPAGGQLAGPGQPMGQGQQAGGLTPQLIGTVLFFPAALLLLLFGVFALKKHSVHVSQGRLVLNSPGGQTSSDIADLLNEKSGKTTAVSSPAGDTRVNTTDQLEKLAKERPTKVAEMLKSTWLSQG